MNNKDISKVREILMNEGNCEFTVKGITNYDRKEDGSYGNVPKVFRTVKLENDEHCGSINEEQLFGRGMNVTKWGPTCVTLYTYDMLGKKSICKIRYADVRFIADKEFKGTSTILKRELENPLNKLDGFMGTQHCTM